MKSVAKNSSQRSLSAAMGIAAPVRKHGERAADAIARSFGVSGASVEHAMRLLRLGCPELIAAVRDGRASVSAAARISRLSAFQQSRWLARQRDALRIYFVQSVVGGPIKIGISKSVEGRLSTLQEGSPFQLRVLATTAGSRREELSLHKRFASSRLHGEWFEPSEELLRHIGSIGENC